VRFLVNHNIFEKTFQDCYRCRWF